MVESFFVILLLCLIFWGFLQAALLYNHERILQFASFAAARSATVGFKPDFYMRSYRVAAIPASGTMLSPVNGTNPGSWTGANQQMQQLGTEQLLIPLYLRAAPTGNLDYAYWEQYGWQPQVTGFGTDTLMENRPQTYPLDMPIISYILTGQTNSAITMMGNMSVSMANQSHLYLIGN